MQECILDLEIDQSSNWIASNRFVFWGQVLYSLYISPLGNIVRHKGLKFHLYANDAQLYFAFRPIPAEQ